MNIMAKTTKSRGRRTQTKKLAAKSGKVSKKEMKKVKGGVLLGLLMPVKAPAGQFTNTILDDAAVKK